VFRTVLAGALAAVVMGLGMTAQAEVVSPEDQIKLRKAGYSYMSWNMGKIKAQVIDQSVAYDQGQILAAARTLDAIANSGMGALYGPGTDRQVGAQQTRVKPEMFDNFPDVAQLSAGLTAATGKLVDAAEADDRAALRTAFAEVGQSCKACHDKYRQR
jgi:cytochrome c556